METKSIQLLFELLIEPQAYPLGYYRQQKILVTHNELFTIIINILISAMRECTQYNYWMYVHEMMIMISITNREKKDQ